MLWNLDCVSVHKKAEEELGQNLAFFTLPLHAYSNNAYKVQCHFLMLSMISFS